MKKRIVVIAPPGSGKTTIEAKLSEAWMEKSPGPVIVISRVKQLIGQVLSELVMMNKFHPDRIACYSEADHEMDLKEALCAGNISDPEVEEWIDECFTTNRNVYIGCVANAGSITLLKHCLDKKYPIRVIVDELAEIIPGYEKDKEKGKENTLELLYRINDAGLLNYIAGFDAVWKTGTWRGMNDKDFWEDDKPTVLHLQEEMTSEKNVLCPVQLIAVEIDEEELEVGDDEKRKRQIEAAANIKILKHEELLVGKGKKPSTKVVAFSSGSDAAKYCKSEIDNYNFDFSIDLNEFVLAGTSPDHRKEIKEKLASKKTKVGIVFNCYERLPGDEILTHIIGRVTRRHPSERGIPVKDLKIKPVGRFYVPYLRSEKKGGGDFTQVLKVYQALYNNGYTKVDAKILRDTSTTKTKEVTGIDNPGADEDVVDIFGAVDENDVMCIQIGKAISALREKIEIKKQDIIDEDFRRVFAVRTDEEAKAHLKSLF
jgi:hypothetical protein